MNDKNKTSIGEFVYKQTKDISDSLQRVPVIGETAVYAADRFCNASHAIRDHMQNRIGETSPQCEAVRDSLNEHLGQLAAPVAPRRTDGQTPTR